MERIGKLLAACREKAGRPLLARSRVHTCGRLLGLSAAPLLLGAASDVTPVGIMAPQGDGRAAATAHLVKSILEYARWPARRDPVRLCVAGPANQAGQLGILTLADGREVVRRILAPDAYSAAGSCDALYLGDMGMDQMRRWTAAARGAPIVTIAESDPSCASEAMFCLLYGSSELSFRLNIDAVARSSVRIDPRVLRMSKGGENR